MQNLQTQYDVFRSMQEERLEKQLKEQTTHKQLPSNLSLRVRLLWYGGDLLINWGKNLKQQVKAQYCGQLTVAINR